VAKQGFAELFQVEYLIIQGRVYHYEALIKISPCEINMNWILLCRCFVCD